MAGVNEMDLEWIIGYPTDPEDIQYTVHYLINPKTAQCYATIAEPRKGHRLFETDIKVRGYDRSYVTLEGAKAYAEFVAVTYEEEEREALEKTMKEPSPEPVIVAVTVPEPVPVKKWWWR
jgi:hypothetical protein